MAKKFPSSSVSNTDCKDIVRIPRSEYMQATAQMKQLKTQLTAASNLHRLIHEKDKEMMACKEKNEQLQLALYQVETRLSSMIQLQNATSTRNSLEEDDAVAAIGTMLSDVETDGEPVKHPAHLPSSHTKVEKLTNKAVVTLGSPVASTELPTSSFTDTCPTCSSSTVTVSSLPVSSSITSLPVSSVANFHSEDLLDKVLQQNVRLKKTLRDFLSQKGLSVSMYLDRQEYEDAAEILRHDLADAQKRIRQLKSVIASRDNGDVDRLAQQCAQLADKVAVLERKLAISQAYADALKRAHDRCRQEGSHVDTSSKPSANYAQVLEELEKVKGHCKDYEAKNRVLLTEKEALEQQLRTSEELLREIDNLKCENQQLVEERQLNKAQIAAYEEDFKLEQTEKQRQRNKYEIDIAKHQEWVRRLAIEAQKCRASWQEEIANREDLKKTIKSLQSSGSSGVWSATSKCSSPPILELTSLHLTDVGADGPPESGVDSERLTNDPLVCPRCEREFPYTDRSRWELHCKRCTDE